MEILKIKELILNKDVIKLNELYKELIKTNKIKPLKFNNSIKPINSIKECVEFDDTNELSYWMWLASSYIINNIIKYG